MRAIKIVVASVLSILLIVWSLNNVGRQTFIMVFILGIFLFLCVGNLIKYFKYNDKKYIKLSVASVLSILLIVWSLNNVDRQTFIMVFILGIFLFLCVGNLIKYFKYNDKKYIKLSVGYFVCLLIQGSPYLGLKFELFNYNYSGIVFLCIIIVFGLWYKKK